jgi:cholesterol oxidase
MKEYDYIIVGSGFGGSVSAYRLAQKGYSVLVIEKGKWFSANDFPKTNWNLAKWLWLPSLRFYGIMKMSFFKDIGILSGTGVGGGSLVYANTLPKPKDNFYKNGSWANLNNWKESLAPHYETALKMLGAAKNPRLETGDLIMLELAKKRAKNEKFEATDVSIFFGEPEVEVNDPYFNGKGPARSGCTFCGACMTGCRHNAKNTLDKNYLFLAQKLGVDIIAEQEVIDVIPDGSSDGSNGYIIKTQSSTKVFKTKTNYKARKIIFSGGVMGTIKLLLKLKDKSLPNISDKLGHNILTNNEALIFSVSEDSSKDLSKGIAIGSILDVDDKTHLEIVRYGEGSGFWRLGMLPNVVGNNIFSRTGNMFLKLARNPYKYLKLALVKDFAKQSTVLLFMQQINTTLQFKKGKLKMKSSVSEGEKPSAQIPLAYELAKQYSEINNAKPMVLLTETLFNMPSTAHILGGAIMGDSPKTGVIDKTNHVFGYKNMMICDGSMISSNPGVNPSLSITAITEYAMSLIPEKDSGN